MKAMWTSLSFVFLLGCTHNAASPQPDVFFEGILPVELAVSGETIYWTETPLLIQAGLVHASHVDGSDRRTIAELGDAWPLGLAADDQHVFWLSVRQSETDSLEAANGEHDTLLAD